MSDTTSSAADATDRELETRISNYLSGRDLPILQKLRFEVSEGVVTVIGEVSSSYERQLVQHYVRRVPGVSTIVDRVAVEALEPAKTAKRRTPAAALKLVDPAELARPVVRAGEKLPAVETKSSLLRSVVIGGVAVASVATTIAGVWLLAGYVRSGHLPVHPAHGRVLYGDEPAAGAKVVLYPTSRTADAPRPWGQCDKDGNFTLTTYEKNDGAPEGQYIVTLEWKKPSSKKASASDKPGDEGQNVLPPKLNSPSRSSLQAKVKRGTNYLPQIAIPR